MVSWRCSAAPVFRVVAWPKWCSAKTSSCCSAGWASGCLAALVAVLPHWMLQQAEVPWKSLGVLLSAIVLAGFVAGGLAVRAAVRAPLLPALRGD